MNGVEPEVAQQLQDDSAACSTLHVEARGLDGRRGCGSRAIYESQPDAVAAVIAKAAEAANVELPTN